MGGTGFLGATLWYGLVLLAFGIAPQLPPAVAVVIALATCVLLLILMPAWVASPTSSAADRFAVMFGTLLGSMLVSFLGFIGSTPADLWFKIVVDLIAVALLLQLGRKLPRSQAAVPA